jgi:hypothetical protein
MLHLGGPSNLGMLLTQRDDLENPFLIIMIKSSLFLTPVFLLDTSIRVEYIIMLVHLGVKI